MRNDFMDEAVKLAGETMRAGRGGPFGAIIVRGDEIVATGSNEVIVTNDPTAHAEIVALRRACDRLKAFHLPDCELYASCEPCPMCLAASYWAKLKGIYYASTRHEAAGAGFADEFLYQELSCPTEKRTLPMKRLVRPEADGLFQEWVANPNRISY